jgi:hypothetical protein
MRILFATMLSLIGCVATHPVVVSSPPQEAYPLPFQPQLSQQIRLGRKELIDLLAPCSIAEPLALLKGEAVRVANARKDSLVKCNEDKTKLRVAAGIEGR